MPAAGQQQQIGKSEVRVGQPRAQRMAFEVVDRDERLARRQGEPLARQQPDHHAADQSRPRGRGDRVDVGNRQIGLGEHLPHEIGQHFDMCARGDFGHHPAERPMPLGLSDDRLREDLPVGRDERRRAVVAGGF